ncbi:UNVERIFIED_CONTAM: putrescine importer [Brevibacillus sp. OAP136]
MSQPRSLKRSLSLFHVIFFGLAYMAPLTIFTTYGVATQASHGMLPAAYIVALIAMAFTAYSYGRMVKVYPMSGSAYTYTQKSLNSHVGFLVGWAILMDYLFLPMINYLVAALYLAIYFPSVPFWVWVISFIVITTVLNILGIKLATNINTLFVIYQFFVLVVFVVLSVKGILHGMGTGTLVSIKPFFNPDVPLSSVMAGASLLCLSFLGFDAVSTLSEETKNPDKTIPKAILLVTLIGGALFIFISYVGHMVYPDYASFKNPDTAAYEMIEYVGGNLLTALFTAASLVGFLASAVAAHGSVTRLLYAMGRDSVLPQKAVWLAPPAFQNASVQHRARRSAVADSVVRRSGYRDVFYQLWCTGCLHVRQPVRNRALFRAQPPPFAVGYAAVLGPSADRRELYGMALDKPGQTFADPWRRLGALWAAVFDVFDQDVYKAAA